MVKMTKCRQMCTPGYARERVARYPHGPAQQAAPAGPLLIWTQRGILNGPCFGRFAPDYDCKGLPGPPIKNVIWEVNLRSILRSF